MSHGTSRKLLPWRGDAACHPSALTASGGKPALGIATEEKLAAVAEGRASVFKAG